MPILFLNFQSLVDHSEAEMNLAVQEDTSLFFKHRLSPPSWGLSFLVAKLLVECIKIRDAEQAWLAIW